MPTLRQDHERLIIDAGADWIWELARQIWEAPLPGASSQSKVRFFRRFCACGCGLRIPEESRRGAPRRYVNDEHKEDHARQRRDVDIELDRRRQAIIELLNLELAPLIRETIEPEFRGWMDLAEQRAALRKTLDGISAAADFGSAELPDSELLEYGDLVAVWESTPLFDGSGKRSRVSKRREKSGHWRKTAPKRDGDQLTRPRHRCRRYKSEG
jgi:hypothetical protein